ncbi:MAG: hypothetical protein M1816_000390 [Peltula sp. TS41687]|nr:MAG: hypothetical protein M1816_000390 [Peltula sp. TS41687]
MAINDNASSSDGSGNKTLQAPDVARSKNLPWYKTDIGVRLTPHARKLFQEYSHVAPEDIESHILKIRDVAWEIFPWPCVGNFWFLSFGLSLHPIYPTILSRLCSSSDKILDLGTCLGQDLRKLLYDGAPLESLYGSDIFPAYEEIGQALFKDEATFNDRFIVGDILDESRESALARTEGSWDVINIIMFLHVFSWTDQLKASKRILDLLTVKPGSMIVGAQAATINPGELAVRPPFVKEGEHRTVFRQSRETFKRMWEEVGRAKGVELKVWAEYESSESEGPGEGKEGRFFTGDDQRRLVFTVERV